MDGDWLNFAQARQVEDLFRHRWDAITLLCLADGPLRYTELANTISSRSGERLADTLLSRCLRRLAGNALIYKGPRDEGHHVYSLTDAGQDQVAILTRISRVLRADSGDRSHGRRQSGPERRQHATGPREGTPRQSAGQRRRRDG
jgi:DNA-binding HxlR family transcriptional regulator